MKHRGWRSLSMSSNRANGSGATLPSSCPVDAFIKINHYVALPRRSGYQSVVPEAAHGIVDIGEQLKTIDFASALRRLPPLRLAIVTSALGRTSASSQPSGRRY